MNEEFRLAVELAPFIAMIVGLIVAGSVFSTWLRIRNGYPLEGSWGNAIGPKTDKESQERIKLLTSENAQLRAEMGSMKDRLETVERIVTDDSHGIAKEIEALRDEPKKLQ